ncbi:MAG: hypothetical protein E7347_05375 [Clostridiales bacterium]|nr:hypothetical protein [Clostridiales bacterium]
MKKTLISILGVALAFVVCFSAFGCTGETAQASSFVSVDINPSIELTLDQNDKVLSVRGTDEDGQVLLYSETGLVGVDVEKAIEKITELAVELGYLSQDNKVVNTSVSAKSKDLADKIKNKVNAKITATVGDFTVTIDEEQAYSLLRKFEQFKLDYPEYADISIDQFKLALSASETGEISLEVAVGLDAKDLIKIVSDAHKALKDYATEEYLKAKHDAEKEFNDNVSHIIDNVYNDFNLVQGEIYKKYIQATRELEGILKSLRFEKIGAYELTTDQVNQIVLALGLDNSEPLKNLDGKVTLDSVYGYLDKTLKNMNEQDATQLKTAIEQTIAQIEASAKAGLKQTLDEHVQMVEELINNINIDGVDFRDGLDVNEMNLMIDYFKVQIQAVVDAIEENIPKEIKHILESIKDFKNKAEYVNHQNQLNNAINQAKLNAQQKLQAIKQARCPSPVN